MITDIRAFVAAIVVCVLVVLTVHALQAGPISQAGLVKSYAWGMLYDYQTLVTGLLAIGAAFVTVREMRRAEVSNEIRHQASMRLAVRGDRLRMHRALHPQFLELKEQRKIMIDRLDDAEMLVVGIDSVVHLLENPTLDMRFQAFVLDLYPSIISIREILARPALQEGAQLFDGDLTYVFSDLIKEVDKAVQAGRGLYDYFEELGEAEHDIGSHAFWDLLDGREKVLLRFPRRFVQGAWAVMEGMSRMARMYDVDHNWSPN